MYKRTLIANRGEIALRILRVLNELNIESVVVYTNVDKDLPYVRLADYSVCIGQDNSKESYLDTYKILSVATMMNCDSIHPGIGFLAENDKFAALCKTIGINFIGPSPEHILLMGNKNSAKDVADECGLPVIRGGKQSVHSIEEAAEVAQEIGYPVLLKAAYGGGGKGIRVANSYCELQERYTICVKEAVAAFGNDELLIEQYIENTRHIEVQIIGDRYGNMVHLGERECTIQRLKQKVIEETPCMNIKKELREKLLSDSLKLGKYLKYEGPGTIEFLVQPDGKYYFLEMNTRLQVEHTITELITGIDIVKEQFKVSSGQELSIKQSDIRLNKYALQARILAESFSNEIFTNSFGRIEHWYMPSGAGIRVDAGYCAGATVTPYYDSLLAKVCCCDKTKEYAIKKLQFALREIEIKGVETNISILQRILKDKRFFSGEYNENFFEEITEKTKRNKMQL